MTAVRVLTSAHIRHTLSRFQPSSLVSDKKHKIGQPINFIGKALVVEDDAEYAALLRVVLDRLGYQYEYAASISKARERLREYTPDLILLDGHLPDGNGLEICRGVRKEARLARALVIVLSAKKTCWQGQEWLRAEADQCWPKIFDVDRLVALISALLRRIDWDTKVTKAAIPGLLIDPAAKTVAFDGCVSQKLADREFVFMNLLFNAYPETLSRLAIQERVFTLSRAEQFDLALNEFIRRLRKKLPSTFSDRIEAVYGHGYRLKLFSGLPGVIRTPTN